MTQPVVEGVPIGPDGPVLENAEDEEVDFFGFQNNDKFFLTKTQWISFHAMNEGEKRRYQSATTRDFVIDSRTRDTKVSVDPGTERKLLIEACADDWHVKRGGQWPAFGKVQLGDFLTLADPSVIEKVEKFVRELNPWLLDDLTVEAIDEEIENLRKQRDTLAKRQAGEGS